MITKQELLNERTGEYPDNSTTVNPDLSPVASLIPSPVYEAGGVPFSKQFKYIITSDKRKANLSLLKL